MAQVTLMPNTAILTVGAGTFISTNTTQVNLQFAPNSTVGFTGIVEIDSSTSPSPGVNDWFPIATLTFTAHMTALDINLYVSDNPWIRANVMPINITTPLFGSISVYAGY